MKKKKNYISISGQAALRRILIRSPIAEATAKAQLELQY